MKRPHIGLLMKSRWALALSIALLIGTNGCRTIPAQNPGLDINLADIRFLSSTALETTAVVSLRLSNESPDPIHVRGGTHRLRLNNIEFGKILSSDELEIPPFSHTTVDASLQISHLRIAARFQTLTQARVFDYELKSYVYLRNPNRRVNLNKAETLDLRSIVN